MAGGKPLPGDYCSSIEFSWGVFLPPEKEVQSNKTSRIPTPSPDFFLIEDSSDLYEIAMSYGMDRWLLSGSSRAIDPEEKEPGNSGGWYFGGSDPNSNPNLHSDLNPHPQFHPIPRYSRHPSPCHRRRRRRLGNCF